MPRLLPCFALLLLAASGAAAQEVRISILPWSEPVLMDTLRQDHELDVPATKVYDAVHRAFSEMGIPVGRTDSRAGVIGSERFERRLSLADTRMAKLFDCGESATGAYADSYRLEIAIAAYVKPNGKGGTTLGIASIATGRDPTGAMRAARGCVSTGALEQKIYNRVVLVAAKAK